MKEVATKHVDLRTGALEKPTPGSDGRGREFVSRGGNKEGTGKGAALPRPLETAARDCLERINLRFRMIWEVGALYSSRRSEPCGQCVGQPCLCSFPYPRDVSIRPNQYGGWG